MAVIVGPALRADVFFDPANLLLGHFPWRAERVPPPRAATNYTLTDQPTQFLVWDGFAATELRQGRVPLWNPNAGCGRPLLANSQSAVLSPFNWGTYLFGERVGVLWAAIGRLLCAAVGAWYCARQLGQAPVGATLAAVAFAFSGPIVVWLGHPHSAVFVALPWLLGGVVTTLRGGRGPGSVLMVALATALAFVGGHAESTFHVAVAAGAWTLWLLWRSPRPRAVAVARLAGGVLLGLLLSAAHWLPFLEYLMHSDAWATRAHGGGALADPLPVAALLTWLLPNVFGHPQASGFTLAGTGFNEVAAYSGIGIPLLAAGAVSWRKFSTTERGLVLLVLGSLLVAYGAPPLPWLLARLPLFRAAVNTRLIAVAALGAALLAGGAIGALPAGTRALRRTGRVCVVVGLLCCLLAAAAPALFVANAAATLLHAGVVLTAGGAALALRAPAWILVIVCTADVVLWARGFNPVTRDDQHYPPTRFIERLQDALDDHAQRRLLARGYLFPAETPMRYGIRDVKGYDAVEPRRYARYMDLAMASSSAPQEPGALHRRIPLMSAYRSPLLDAAAASVVVSDQPLTEQQFTLLASAPGIFAYRNTRALPRARLAAAAEVLPAEDAVARRLAQPGHDPRNVTLLEGPALPYPVGGHGTVRFLADEPNFVQIEVEAKGDALLVLADTAFPGWEARVDGEPTAIWIADLTFRAVPVRAGRHVVTFRYRPPVWRVGLALTVFGVLGVGGLCAMPRRGPPSVRTV